ncbi:MFS transporter [Microlunatus sp. Y2014]|uniref:MFS transporter n=1 Tax=Microlunatus sp. Y2014 TaxID=3418488 RepID=UPI003DA70772
MSDPSSPTTAAERDPRLDRPWPALWSMVFGFFMILVDTTIVSVAMPKLMEGLRTDINGAIWVTSAYLLAYAVPLLITGRLGDRVGPRTMYVIGLGVFTGASLWCGFADSIEMLIIARVVQGLGAACLTPQTMTTITRLFPGQKRGPAMSVWGATAGIAILVGPLLGGVLTDLLGWEWIFFVNVPVGVVGIGLALRFVPRFPVRSHSFDWLGVVLSAIAMFLLVFGIQEGETYAWGTITDSLVIAGVATGIPVSVPGLIIAGVGCLTLFLVWQAMNRREPLIPLGLFTDRNFSVASVAIAAMGFAMTGIGLPYTLYLQLARGMSPTQAALMLIPMAVMSLAMARPVGRLVGRVDPRFLAMAGFGLTAVSMVIFWLLLHTDTTVWVLLVPATLQGFSTSLVWSPLSMNATYNLPMDRAGAGSGVYNTTRQVGSVLGSAAIAAVMQMRLVSHLGGGAAGSAEAMGPLPEPLREPFAAAMGEAMLLPGIALAVGFVATLVFAPIRRHDH